MGAAPVKVFGTGVDSAPKRMRLALRGGDVCDPQDGNQLDGPPWPSRAVRWYCPWPVLPWVSVRFDLAAAYGFMAGFGLFPGLELLILALLALIVAMDGRLHRFGFYAGWKVYGFDLPNYANWCGGRFKDDISKDALALELTARFFTDGD